MTKKRKVVCFFQEKIWWHQT